MMSSPTCLPILPPPREHHTKLHATNTLERLNGEIRPRTELVESSFLRFDNPKFQSFYSSYRSAGHIQLLHYVFHMEIYGVSGSS